MIDLHMHSTYSDGKKTVLELLKMCEELKLEYISITDHDSCMQYTDEAFVYNDVFSGKIIKGCELRAAFKDKYIEILAYDIDTDYINKWRTKYYTKELELKRHIIFKERLLEIIKKNNMTFDEKNIIYDVSKPYTLILNIYNELIKYPNNFKLLGEKVKTYSDFFRKCLSNKDSIFFLNMGEFSPSYKEIIDIIHEAGGKAFLAHPFEYGFKDTLTVIDNLIKEAPLYGIECYHPSSMVDDKYLILLEYAKKHNLKISGGSDYHGSNKPSISLGIGEGSQNISKEILTNWNLNI